MKICQMGVLKHSGVLKDSVKPEGKELPFIKYEKTPTTTNQPTNPKKLPHKQTQTNNKSLKYV